MLSANLRDLLSLNTNNTIKRWVLTGYELQNTACAVFQKSLNQIKNAPAAIETISGPMKSSMIEIN
jgi:hypothetical protein